MRSTPSGKKKRGRRLLSPTPPARHSPSRLNKGRRRRCSSRPTSTGWTTLAQKNLIKPEARSNLLGNRLVLIAPKDAVYAVGIKRGFDLAKILGNGRLAMANVDAVPAGKYGKAALQKLGVWASVANKVAQVD